jgi:glycosyltransferase involved in cell wall biosynthesis
MLEKALPSQRQVRLSIIVPFFNEVDNLAKLHKEISEVLGHLPFKSEVLYVNDGSTDSSREVLLKAIKKSKHAGFDVIIINFRRNFGQTAAISAGIDNSQGKLVSFLDADLQNDPKDLPRFLKKMDNGNFDAVFGWRKERKDATLRSLLSRKANLIIKYLFSYPFNDVGCSARVVKREFLNDLGLYGELHRILPVLVYLKGAKIGEIVVSHRNRFKGKSKYGFERIVKTVIDITVVKFLSVYGTKPAYVFGFFGLGSLLIGFVSLLAVTYRKLFLGVYVHKDPFFLIAIFFGFIGVQFILMGLLAEIQIRTYFESQKKHIYDIRELKKY